MGQAARVGMGVGWLGICFVLGIFGGLAGAYIIGLPLTVLVPILPVRMARHRNKGRPTLLAYCAGLATVPAWVVAQPLLFDLSPHRPSGGTVTIAIVLAILCLVMASAAWLPFVREGLP